MNKLSEIILNERLFVIDPISEHFFQKDNPQNIIRFPELWDDGAYYLLHMDSALNQSIKGNPGQDAAQNMKQLVIPKEILKPSFLIDPEYIQMYNKSSYQNHWGTLLIDEGISQRLKGTLPELEIEGERWYIDLPYHEIVFKGDPKYRIDLRELWTSEGQELLRCFYDKNQKTALSFSPELIGNKGDIMLLEMPGPMCLDPIGYARNFGLHDFSLIQVYPQLPLHQAQLKPYIPKIEMNNFAQRQLIERQLPEYQIDGTVFQVDVVNKELRELANPVNTISFLDMSEDGKFYTFHYDQELKTRASFATFLQKQASQPEPAASEAPAIASLYSTYEQEMKENLLTIPQMVILDPEGMAFLHKVPLSEIHTKTDFELLVDQFLYQDRINGNLPQIDILGQPYYVDLRMDLLRPAQDPELPEILFSQLEVIDDLGRLGFVYDPKSRHVPKIELEKLTQLPKDCHYLRIPAISSLDPVGYARKMALNVRDFVRANPLQPRLRAEVMDWHATKYMQAILQNKTKLLKEQLRPQLKKIRNKKGKGI